jgi:hypothetical protein
MITIQKQALIFFTIFQIRNMLYYGFRTGADLILENNLSDICPTCENIPWKILMQLLALTKKQIQTIIISLILMDKNYI